MIPETRRVTLQGSATPNRLMPEGWTAAFGGIHSINVSSRPLLPCSFTATRAKPCLEPSAGSPEAGACATTLVKDGAVSAGDSLSGCIEESRS